MTPMLSARNLSKRYERGGEVVDALDAVDLDVPPGDFLALMGPSGSGKSTLLNIAAGIDEPTAGTCLVDGRDVQAMRSGERDAWRTRSVGYIFQFYNLIPTLTAAENVELPLLLLPLSRAERREHVAAALDLVGLSDRTRHTPAQLSGGQQQRVAIARALVTDARLLLADEPTGNLDATSEEEVMHLLRRLVDEHGKTVVMVTHDPTAAAHASRRLRLEKGRLVNTLETTACSH
jgi:putative ABC transport system ATP-binding protein